MLDAQDAFPLDACASINTDGDERPDTLKDNCRTSLTEDLDDDNDGVADLTDAFPLEKCASVDTDGDRIPDTITGACSSSFTEVEDLDDDNDGVADLTDAFPLEKCASIDTDGDRIPDTITGACTSTLTADTDDDNDEVLDAQDAFPLEKCASVDTDGDRQPDTLKDNCTSTLTVDTDDDNDGVADTADAFPLDACASVDENDNDIPDILVPNCQTSLTAEVFDTTPPAPVGNLNVRHDLTTIEFTWTDPNDSDLAGIMFQWFIQGGAMEQTMVDARVESLTFRNLADDTVYYYNVYAVDEETNLSTPVAARVKITGQRYFPIQIVRYNQLGDLHLANPQLDTDNVEDYTYEIISGNYNFADETPGHADYDPNLKSRPAYILGVLPTSAAYSHLLQRPKSILRVLRPSAFLYDRDQIVEIAVGGRGGDSMLPELWNTPWLTFLKTQTDELIIAMTQPNGVTQQIKIRLSPEPEVVRIHRECADETFATHLEEFLCLSSREYLPQGYSRQPTAEEIAELPAELRTAWGSDPSNYDISIDLDFSTTKLPLEQIVPDDRFEPYANRRVSTWWRLPGKDPILVLTHNGLEETEFREDSLHHPVVEHEISGTFGEDGFTRKQSGTGRYQLSNLTLSWTFQFSSGFFEMRILPDFPFIAGDLLPIHGIWSRFGNYHGVFGYAGGITAPLLYGDIWRELLSGAKVKRSEFAQLGFLELDFSERWLTRQTEFFFTSHQYPSSSVEFLFVPDENSATGFRKVEISGDRHSGSAVFDYPPIDVPTNYGLWLEPDHHTHGITHYRKKPNQAQVPVGNSLNSDALSWTNVMKADGFNFVAGWGREPISEYPGHTVPTNPPGFKHTPKYVVPIDRRQDGTYVYQFLEERDWAIKIDYIRLWQRRDRPTRSPIRYLCAYTGCPAPE